MTKVVKKKRKLHYILPGMLGVLVLILFINFFQHFNAKLRICQYIEVNGLMYIMKRKH